MEQHETGRKQGTGQRRRNAGRSMVVAGSFGLHADLELGAAGLKLQQKGSMSPLQPEGCRGMQEESDKWPAKANGVSGAQPVNMECDLPQRQGNGWARHGGGQGAGTGPARPGTAPLQPWPVQQHLLQQQPPQQQQAPAAEAGTPKAAPLAAAGEVPPDESQLAMAELEAILTRISQLDAEGWFQAPVSEADAPRYYSIIKQPMCFAVMRSKIRARQYVNWQEVVRDFELICTNAMKYNQKRSRIHKLALVMLRAGKKLLIEVETQGRKAIERLHPAGGAAAAAAAAAAASTPLLGHSLLLSPALASTGGLTPRADTVLTCGAMGYGGLPRSVSVMDTAATLGAQPEAMLLEGPLGGQEGEAGYSSFEEETDLENDGREADTAKTGLPGLQPLPYVIPAVLRQPWDAVAGVQDAAAASAGPALSREWRQARRGVEWRVRWLELRLRELHHQRAHYQQQLSELSPAARPPPGQQQQPGPVLDGRRQREGKQPQQLAPAVPAQQAAACEPRPWQAVPELQLPQLLEHPFFGEHSTLGWQQSSKRQRTEGGAFVAADGSGPPGQQQPPAVDDPDFPARAHAALDLLDRRLSSLRRQLVALQAPATLGATGGLLPRPAPIATRVGGFGTRSSGLGRRSTVPRRADGLRAGGEDLRALKRRRQQEAEVAELLPGILMLPKFVERVNREIDTPRINTLSGMERKKRQAAVDALAAALKGGGKPDAAALAAIDALCPGESSGEEESGDEAFAARHAKLEAEERARYESVPDGTRGARNKNASSKVTAKEPRSKQQHHHFGQQGNRGHVHRTTSAPAKLAAAGGAGAPMPPTAATPTSARSFALPTSLPATPRDDGAVPATAVVAAAAAAAAAPKQPAQQQVKAAPGSAPPVLGLGPAAAKPGALPSSPLARAQRAAKAAAAAARAPAQVAKSPPPAAKAPAATAKSAAPAAKASSPAAKAAAPVAAAATVKAPQAPPEVVPQPAPAAAAPKPGAKAAAPPPPAKAPAVADKPAPPAAKPAPVALAPMQQPPPPQQQHASTPAAPALLAPAPMTTAPTAATPGSAPPPSPATAMAAPPAALSVATPSSTPAATPGTTPAAAAFPPISPPPAAEGSTAASPPGSGPLLLMPLSPQAAVQMAQAMALAQVQMASQQVAAAAGEGGSADDCAGNDLPSLGAPGAAGSNAAQQQALLMQLMRPPFISSAAAAAMAAGGLPNGGAGTLSALGDLPPALQAIIPPAPPLDVQLPPQPQLQVPQMGEQQQQLAGASGRGRARAPSARPPERRRK